MRLPCRARVPTRLPRVFLAAYGGIIACGEGRSENSRFPRQRARGKWAIVANHKADSTRDAFSLDLRKLLEGEIKTRGRKNIVQSRSFAEMLEKSLARYQNRAIETAQVIEELIALARELREADRRGDELGLTQDEIAFYDALEVNDSAVQVLGLSLIHISHRTQLQSWV